MAMPQACSAMVLRTMPVSAARACPPPSSWPCASPWNRANAATSPAPAVYTSADGGLNWYRENVGFGNVSVEHLEINTTGTKRLFAFTHGRGAWRVDLIPDAAP